LTAGDTVLVVGPLAFLDKFQSHFYVASTCESKEEVAATSKKMFVAVPS